MLDIYENEHQELFHLGVDLTQPLEVHIPSPLGPLGYYLFVRVPAAAGQLDGVSARFDLIGLHETHITMAPGDGALAPATLPSTQPGLQWRCLGKALLARGDGTMTLHGWPAGITRADLLLCTWPRFLASGMAEAMLAAQDDPHWAPSGVPLGGIGGGRVDICRDGRFRNFSMNNNQDAPLEDADGLAGAYLAVACEGAVTELSTRPIVASHASCARLDYTPRFPQATLAAPGIAPALDVRVTLTGTLCPHDLRRSAIPGFLIRWEVTNTGAEARTVRCEMGWPNLIGVGGGVASVESGIGYGDGSYRYWNDDSGRAQRPLAGEGYQAIRYTGEPGAQYLASAGEHLLGVATKPGVTADVRCGAQDGVISAELSVPAGGRATATMALVAAMPHWVDSLSVDRGRYWQCDFADGAALLAALFADAEELLADTGALAALLDDSTLPGWLRQRLCNCTYPLVTNSVLYRDGRFSINEGPTEMAGCYGTIDQRLAAHPATQLLFPALNARELEEFGAIQNERGGMQHDLGSGHLERGAGETTWPDLTCSFIIQCARHAWSTGDNAFAAQQWPRVRHALLRHAEWATEGDGVAQVGAGLGTSYDSYHYYGTTGYMGTLWLAALAVCEHWARRVGDHELRAQIPGWRAAAIARLEADLWNGRYYIAYGNTSGTQRDTSHAGQLAGQVFARLLCNENVLDEERVRSCVEALLALNGSTHFAIPPDEVSPDGGAGSDYGWVPYVEGFMLTAIAGQQDARLWPLWQRTIAAVEGDGRHPCDTRLMYRPLTGEQSWGSYYMTAPASWLVYDAWLGFFYDAGEGRLRLHTLAPGRYPIVHPLFWGTLSVSDTGAALTVTRLFTDTPLKLSSIEPRSADGSTRRIDFAKPGYLRVGVAIKWS